MASVGGAAAAGLESGLGLGLRMRALEQQDQDRQRRQQAEDEDRALRAEDRTQRQADRQRQEQDRGMQALDAQLQALRSEGESYAQQYGANVPPEIAGPYQQRVRELTTTRDDMLRSRYEPIVKRRQQQMADVLSRIQTDPTALQTVGDGDLYAALETATRRDPRDLLGANGQPSRVDVAVTDIMNGLQTGNEAMALRGANVLLEPELRTGVGNPSPHGGVIVGKRIEALVPHPEKPGEFTPMLRVYVGDGKIDTPAEVANADRIRAQDPDAPPNATGYYLAPVTQNRSTDAADPVHSISVERAMDYAARLQTLSKVLTSHPELRGKLERGAAATSKAGGDNFLTAFAALGGRMPAKQVEWKSVRPGERLVGIDPRGAQVGTIEGPPKAAPTSGLGGQVASIQAYADENDMTFDEAAALFQRRGLLRAPKGGAGSAGGGGGGGLPAMPKAGATGEDVLAGLSVEDATLVRGLADGTIVPDGIEAKGGRRARLLALAKQFKDGADLSGRKREAEKPMPAKERQLLVEARTNASTITSLLNEFKNDFASKGVAGFGADLSLRAKSVLGNDTASVQWWKNYRKMAELVERHAMFGAALTAAEQGAWKSADIDPGMDADVIRNNLNTRAAIAQQVLQATQQDLIDGGYSEDRVRKIGGRDVEVPLDGRSPGVSGSWDAPPRAPAPAPSPGPKPLAPTNAKGWRLMTDAKGNRAYVSPDGKSFEEVR